MMMTAVGFSIASLSAHAAANGLHPKEENFRLNTHELIINRYVSINHSGGDHVESGATGGSTSKNNVTPGAPRGTPNVPVTKVPVTKGPVPVTNVPAKAPELDPASVVGGLTLLAGAIVVLRGRRRVLTPC